MPQRESQPFSMQRLRLETRLLQANSFHPHISTLIHREEEAATNDDQDRGKECRLDIIYELPPSVFVDPNQLADALELNHPWVFGETDLEAPLEHVREQRGSIVIVRPPFINQSLISLDLPIHLRYQRPSANGTHRAIRIQKPRAGWTCGDRHSDLSQLPALDHPLIPKRRLVDDKSRRLQFIEMTQDSGFLELAVPVGSTEDANVVLLGTFLTVVLCTVWILLAIRKGILKQRRYEAKGKRRRSE